MNLYCISGNINMVEVVRISKDGFLLEIKKVSDKYRDIPYNWDLD